MNIFVLDENPIRAAEMMCDKHIPKMVVESAQMMASAVRRWGATDEHMPLTKAGLPYKGAYKNHPCTIWAGDTFGNFSWLTDHAMALCVEYTSRFGKEHTCADPISRLWHVGIVVSPSHRRTTTPFALAMPDEFRPNHQPKIGPTFQKGQWIYHSEVEGDSHASGDDAVQAYRRYYHSKTFAKWEKGTPAPDWWRGIEVRA